MKIFVQFRDKNEDEIVSYFMSAQNHDVYENLGEIETNDERWKKYFESLPPYVQELLPQPD
ncbi:hypothetical protein C1N60_09000 [Pantoea sp. SGAir0184]